MTKVLIANGLYSPYIGGGAEIICQNMAKGLKSKGFDVYVLTLNMSRNTIEDVVNGIVVYRIGYRNIYALKREHKPSKLARLLWHGIDIYNPFIKSEVDKIIHLVKPDVAITHNITGFSISLWNCLKSNKVPIIEVLHDQYLRCPNSNASRDGIPCTKQCFRCKLMRLPHRKASNSVDIVVGVSKYIVDKMYSDGYFKNSKRLFVHNAQDLPFIPIKNKMKTFTLGYIGSISSVKGVSWLIETFKNIEQTINAKLLIAGKGTNQEYMDYIKSIAGTDENIKFLGYVKPVDFYNQIDVCVMPSLWPDTFPGVAYESCAYNVPVIASNIGGLPEIIHNNVNGILINPSNKESLKEAILKLYNDKVLLKCLSYTARNSVKELTDVDAWIDRYVKIIDSVIYNS